MTVSIKPLMRKVYDTAMKSFNQFLDMWAFRGWPFDEQLLLYTALLSIWDKSPKTVTTYVSAIKSEYKLLGITVKNDSCSSIC